MNAHLTLNTPFSSAVIEVTYITGDGESKAYGYFEAQHLNANLVGYSCIGSQYNLSAEILPVSHVADFVWDFPSGCLFDGNPGPYSPGPPQSYSSGTFSITNSAVCGNICVYVTNAGCSDVGSPICQYMYVSAAAPNQPGIIYSDIDGLPCPDNHWELSIDEVQGTFYYDWWQNSSDFLLDPTGTFESELIIKHGAFNEGTTVYVEAWNGCGYSPYRSRSFRTLSKDQCEGKKSTDLQADISIYPNPVNGQLFINLPQSDHPYKMFMYNIVGMLVINNNKLQTGENSLQLNEFSPGTYYIKITNESCLFLKKIIVTR